MKNRNIYRNIVIILLAAVLIQKCWQKKVEIKQERNTYEYLITSPSSLTENQIEELKKLEGIQDFYSVISLQCTLKLEGYTMDVSLKGVNIKSYPLQLSSVKENLFLGSKPLLFISSDCLEQFMDTNAHGPSKKKIRQWKKEYQQLSLEALFEEGLEKEKVEIAGIFKENEANILMDQSQLKAMVQKWGKSPEITQGYLFIKGKKNAKQAAEVLEAAGFAVEK